jgi:hypothetical protein
VIPIHIFLQFSQDFSREIFFYSFHTNFLGKFFLEKIPVNFYSGFISIPLDCFCARSYLRSLKSLIFGGGRRRNIRIATIMHLPKRIFSRKLALQDFSREKKRYRNFLEKISATGIFSRKEAQQEFSREINRYRNFLEKRTGTGLFSRKIVCRNGKKWKYLLRDLE